MRLSLAIELDEAARAAVVSLQRRLLGAQSADSSALRMVRPEQLHLTLVFLGEVSEDGTRAVMDALDPPLTCAPYTLTLGGVGVFPSHGAPRVLWLGVVVGRWRGGRPGHHHTLAKNGPSATAAVASTRVDAVTLFHSRWGRAGASHAVLLRTRLGGV